MGKDCRRVWITKIHSIYSTAVTAPLTASLMEGKRLFIHSKSVKALRKVLIAATERTAAQAPM